MQLACGINLWLKTIETGKESCTVLMDFVKAFVRVWHPGLPFKLASTGAFLDCSAWFRLPLSERTITIRVGETLSSPRKISAGVTEGSRLGPLLFLLLINV